MGMRLVVRITLPPFVGGEIVSTFGNPEKVKLGQCKLIDEVMIGEDKVCCTHVEYVY